MIPRDPVDGPSVETESCDLGDCHEPWAAEVEVPHGPRSLRLCEEHADRWLRAERELDAELEEMRGRVGSLAPLFGLARALDGRARKAG